MENRYKALIWVGAVAIVLVSLFYYYGKDLSSPKDDKNEFATKFPVPAGVKVPENGETAPKDVAAPISVVQSAPGVQTKIRTFNIKAERNIFNPSTVIVNVGDTVHINFTPIDKTYDITLPDYGLKQTVAKGETKILEFQALNEGKYLYYCDLCGGANSSAKGYVIISKK